MKDLISKEIEIIKAKMLCFLAVAGGSWIYSFKDISHIINILAIMLFMITSFGVISSMIKLSTLEQYIKTKKEEKLS